LTGNNDVRLLILII